MKLGVENKKSVWALAVLSLGLGYAFYDNVIATGPSSSPATSTAAPPAAAPLAAPPVSADDSAPPTPSRGNRNRSGEFHPIVHAKRPEDRVDTANVDPTLQLGLLAKLQAVPAAGDGRNLFAIGVEVAKAPAGPEPKIVPRGPKTIGPPPPPPPPGPPPPAPLPPINFKYYGFSTVRKDGRKAAFFLQNDVILIKAEGEIVAGSYKLIRIDRATAVVEDTKSKRQQTVVLAEEAQQG
ncbi:MAG: hypothetical protein ACLQVN_14830 [Bryobacteraceae bacterium]